MKNLMFIILAALLLVGCADNQAAEMQAETATQNVQQIKVILTDLSDKGIFVVDTSGDTKLENYEQLSAEELENFKSQLATLIQLGHQVLAIDARRDVRVKDADIVERIVQLAEEALTRVSDLKNENAYLG